MNYMITGVTGLVGSHILFELMKKKLARKNVGLLYLLVRAEDNAHAERRLAEIFSSTALPTSLRSYGLKKLLGLVHPVCSDLRGAALFPAMHRLPLSQTTVIHSAASTNLMPGKLAEEETFINNNVGTQNLLAATMGCKKFVYISTAFSGGLRGDVLPDDFTPLPGVRFRNPYEENKAQVESQIRYLEKKGGTQFQILRPSIVCGRLHEDDRFVTSKFDVFYGWTKFFAVYREVVNDLGIRIPTNPIGTMNIVPVDYVAKTVVSAVARDDVSALNIVNSRPPRHRDCIKKMLNVVGVYNYRFVDDVPIKQNRIEKLYTKSIGKAFSPYLATLDARFDTTLLEQIAPVPQMDVLDNMEALIRYAHSCDFKDGFIRRPRRESHSPDLSPLPVESTPLDNTQKPAVAM